MRRSIRSIRSISGKTKITPGPRYGLRRPSRKTTARSYSLRTLSPLIRPARRSRGRPEFLTGIEFLLSCLRPAVEVIAPRCDDEDRCARPSTLSSMPVTAFTRACVPMSSGLSLAAASISPCDENPSGGARPHRLSDFADLPDQAFAPVIAGSRRGRRPASPAIPIMILTLTPAIAERLTTRLVCEVSIRNREPNEGDQPPMPSTPYRVPTPRGQQADPERSSSKPARLIGST